MEYYSTLRKNELIKSSSKWMGLEKIMLGEANQTQKDKHHMFSFICGP